MKKKPVLAALFAAHVLACPGQSNGQGVLPIAGPACPEGWFCTDNATVPPNFRAALTGAEAIPPNQSPFTATATITLRDSVDSFGVTLTNLLYFYLHFPDSLVTNDLGASPALLATVQTQSGETVTSAGGPLIFEKIYSDPLYPCFGICPPFVQHINYQGWFLISPEEIGELLAGRWYVDLTAFHADGTAAPEFEIRGEILPLDSDNDRVVDYLDHCPNTASGAVVDGTGCSIDELAPCAGPWRDHKGYVKAVRDQAFRFWKEGRMTVKQRNAIIQQAQDSNCPPPRPVPGF